MAKLLQSFPEFKRRKQRKDWDHERVRTSEYHVVRSGVF